MRLLY
ncbi:hypothetical protein D049_1960A, partial [Vibrio parahaemolyticus VPTS-2010]